MMNPNLEETVARTLGEIAAELREIRVTLQAAFAPKLREEAAVRAVKDSNEVYLKSNTEMRYKISFLQQELERYRQRLDAAKRRRKK